MPRDHHLLPVVMAMAGIAFLSLMDAFMKSASLAVGAYSAGLLRVCLALVIAVPIWLATGAKWPARKVMRWHLARGFVSAYMALTFFYALTKLPIAEAIAISFVAPILALYLAALFLKETIGRGAIYAAVLGFAGTLIIVGGKIGRGRMDEDTILGLVAMLFSATLYAVNFIIIRRQSQAAKPMEIAVFHSAIQIVALIAFAPFFLQFPESPVWRDLGFSAVLTVFGALAIAHAYARAEAQKLIPLEYTGFLWAALFGYLMFGEAVTWTTIAGAAVIVIGCWIAARRPTEFTQI